MSDTIRVIPDFIDVPHRVTLWGERCEPGAACSRCTPCARGVAVPSRSRCSQQETTRLASTRDIDPEAYDAYLKSRAHFYRLTPADMDAALDYFNPALDRAPDSALAHAWSSIAHASRAQLGVVSTVDAYVAAKPAAERALQLDPDLPEAHFAAAIVHTWQEWDWAAAEREFQKAIALNASYADVRAGSPRTILTIVGRPAESIEQIERAIVLGSIQSAASNLSRRRSRCRPSL